MMVFFPKNTITCCWSLRANSELYLLIQYFVGIEGRFAYDLSSNVLGRGNDAGATFMSSLFNHCTTVPVWSDRSSHYHLECLKEAIEMYNFAWGTNGGEWWRRGGHTNAQAARDAGQLPIREAMARMREAEN